MRYDFRCDPCDVVREVQAPIAEGPTPPVCPVHGEMRRIYGDTRTTQLTVYFGRPADYIERAYRGDGDPPAGMTRSQVRAIVDKSREHIVKGRANSRVYRTAR